MRESRRPRLILGILLLVAFSLVAIDLRADANGPLGGLKRMTGSVFGPLESGTSSLTSPLRGLIGSLTSGSANERRIADLEAEVARLRATGSSPDAVRRIAEIDDLLRMSQAGQYRMVVAQVSGVGSAQGFAHTVTIDAGEVDGLGVDMTVMAGGGLAGRVVSVSSTSAVVVLISDATNTVGGRLEGSGEIGFVSGTGSEFELEFKLLDPYGSLKPGDSVLTFGSKSGRPYVPGVPIGIITSVSGTPGQLTRQAKIRPFVNMSTLDLVAVVVEPPRENPRDSVLVPTAAPSGATSGVPTPGAPTSAAPSPSPGASGSASNSPVTASPNASTPPPATASPRPTSDGASAATESP